MYDAIKVNIKPPRNPSQDFFGDIEGKIFLFPKLIPKIYAKVSNVQVNIKINKIILEFISSF